MQEISAYRGPTLSVLPQGLKNLLQPCFSSQIHLFIHFKENGPTICGDEWTDPEVMKYLECELVQQAGNIL